MPNWEGKPTYVVGSSSPGDTTSPQFWVEKERLIVTCFLLPLVPSPENRNQDVRLENNVPLGGGWLATRVRMLDKGAPMQTEEYSDWRAGVDLQEGAVVRDALCAIRERRYCNARPAQ